ncbi:alpha/beta fold hydrolase [Rhodopseudomonas pseudopalustris]|uniref:Pimeloyl-ACP methyl ester carboxylesterase n=1 Tax=Rhodopseudomonas pseudopalustris TaxID=1513892 RepID=A0A1H8P5C1_9BRAD|nr:alpha/beta hydrolase [Rhodopseudomonas pseudopalustris]MBB1093044.1 alpha/beta hydrolase [Rhodopseudomonas palustris]SEO37129.1 Pimeloyl-ACP methyl ester carboxylesterase [Rhodopseudomonas pseudopalustris]
MVLIGAVATLAVLALLTHTGVLWLQSKFPPQGELISVGGGVLHVVDLGPRGLAEPPIVMIHGASSNLRAMQAPLGDRLAQQHRVLLVDRPGHGWSFRDDLTNSSPAMQAQAIGEALDRLGVSRAIFVVHSMAGALGARLALDQPQRVAGLVMLAPVTHPWRGGVGTYNQVMTTPVIGPLLAHTVTLPLGLLLTEPGARAAFTPQTMPVDYVDASATPLLLRPRAFLANSWDLTTLNEAVAEQAARYPQITAPTVLIHGDADRIVSVDVHSRAFAAAVPQAKLIVLPDVGHMVQNTALDLVQREVEALIATTVTKSHAALH